jgi:hypothetical protein
MTFLSTTTPRSAEQAALGNEIIDLMDVLKVEKAILLQVMTGALLSSMLQRPCGW